jgi:vacuolar protein 8
VERGNFPRTTQNNCVTALLMLSFLVCSDLYIRRITDRQAAVLCSTEDPARAYMMHNALLSRAIKASPRLGDEIARHLFQPDPERRFTAHLLLVTLNERYPVERNDPVLPAEVENRPGEIAHDDPPGHVGGDKEGAGENDLVRIEAAEQNQGEGVAAAARLADPPRQEILDHDPLREFEVVLAVAGPEDLPQGVVNHLPEIVPPAPDDAGGMPLVDEPRAGPVANLGQGVELPPREEVPNQAHERADLGGVAVADEPVPAAALAPEEEAPLQVPLVFEHEPAQAAREHRAAHLPKKWGLRHVVMPLAVVAAAVCLALVPELQQRATWLVEPLRIGLAQMPPLWSRGTSWEPSWANCEAFNAENCSATALVRALAQSTGSERFAAAGVLSDCAFKHKYEDTHSSIPTVVSALVRQLKLQSGASDAYDAAATSKALQGLLPGPDGKIDGAAAIEHLVRLLESEAEDVRDAAALVLRGFTINAAVADAVTEKDLVPALVRMLGADTVAVRAAAAWTLYTCAAASPQHVRSISTAGALQPLVALLMNGTLDEQEPAAGAIGSLAQLPETHQPIVEAGCIPSLMQLLRTGCPTARVAALRTVLLLIGYEQYNHLLVEAGVVPLLASMLADVDEAAKSTASKAIKKLFTSSKGATDQVTVNTATALVQVLREGTPVLQEAVAVELQFYCVEEATRRVLSAAEIFQPMVQLLNGGTERGKETAARMVRYFGREPGNRVTIAAAGAIPELVQLLWEGTAAAREQAANGLWNLAFHNAHNKKVIADAGAIPLLLQMLGRSSEDGQNAAAGALRHLTDAADNRKAIADAGVVPQLVQLLERGSGDVHRVAGVLKILAINPDTRKTIAEAEAIPLLVQLLGKDSEEIQHAVAGALINLAMDNDNQKSIAAAGAVPLLVQLLENGSDRMQEVAAGALQTLALDAENMKLIRTAGAIPLLVVDLLRDGTHSLQAAAARALWNLSVDEQNKKAIAAAGAIPVLMHLERGGTDVGRVTAVEVLGNLALEADNRKAIAMEDALPAIKHALFSDASPPKQYVRLLCNLAEDPALATRFVQDGFVPRLVQLTAVESPEVQKQAVWALENLVRSVPEHRALIIEAGAVTPLQKLRDGDHQELKERALRALQLLGKE